MRRALCTAAALLMLAGCSWPKPTPTPPPPTTTTTVPTTTTTATTVTPTTPVTTTAPTASTPPPAGAFPTPDTAGVERLGLALVLHLGDLIADQPGQVIDGVHVTGGIIVKAHGVRIVRSWVDVGVWNWDHLDSSFTITDTTVGQPLPKLPDGTADQSKCRFGVSVGGHHFVATRVKTQGADDAYRAIWGTDTRVDPPNEGAHVVIRDSYAQLCGAVDSHGDGIQACCNATEPGDYDHVWLDHNTIDQRGALSFTAPINLLDPHLANVKVTNNLLLGGTWTLHGRWTSGPKWLVSGNKVADGSWAFGPFNLDVRCDMIEWGPGNATVQMAEAGGYTVAATVTEYSKCPA